MPLDMLQFAAINSATICQCLQMQTPFLMRALHGTAKPKFVVLLRNPADRCDLSRGSSSMSMTGVWLTRATAYLIRCDAYLVTVTACDTSLLEDTVVITVSSAHWLCALAGCTRPSTAMATTGSAMEDPRHKDSLLLLGIRSAAFGIAQMLSTKASSDVRCTSNRCLSTLRTSSSTATRSSVACTGTPRALQAGQTYRASCSLASSCVCRLTQRNSCTHHSHSGCDHTVPEPRSSMQCVAKHLVHLLPTEPLPHPEGRRLLCRTTGYLEAYICIFGAR
jgi:hypothetical protein